jgi:hypothetical protein
MQLTVSPPSTTSSVPVMYFASSDARNSTGYATSQASPNPPHRTLLVTPADHLFGAAAVSGDDTGGRGPSAYSSFLVDSSSMVCPAGAHWRAMARVNWMTAALVAA